MSVTRSIKTCEFKGCGRKHEAKGLCDAHRNQRARGKPLTELRRRRQNGTDPVIEFDTVPCRNADLVGPCHVFRGAKTRAGYGTMSNNREQLYVHRYVWEQTHGPIPTGLVVDHRCRNRACCNIDHLRVVTFKVNATENVERTVKTHCPQGHELSADNVYRNGSGRKCKICTKVRAAEQKAKQRKG